MIRLSIFNFIFLISFSCSTNENNEISRKFKTTNTGDSLKIFTWYTELCENQGLYNSNKYTKEQLQNTYDLWFGSHLMETDATASEPSDITNLSIEKLTKEYIEKSSKLKNDKIVPNPYWKRFRKLRIQELEEEYKLKKITIEAYKNPQALLNTSYSTACSEFVDALSSDDTTKLLDTWKIFAEAQSKNNGSPETYMKNFYEKYYSEDKLIYAKIELMRYGWWNCGNGQNLHIHRDLKMEEEFNKIFKEIITECEEP